MSVRAVSWSMLRSSSRPGADASGVGIGECGRGIVEAQRADASRFASTHTLFDIGAIRHELGKSPGIPANLLTPDALPDSFRAKVLAEARSI